MGGNKHTGVGNGSARNHYLAIGQYQDAGVIWGGTGGGTADVITISLTPAISAYAAGQCFRFISSGANTTNVTLNVNSVGAKAVNKRGGTALIAGDIPNGAVVEVVYDGTDFELTNIQPLITAAGAALIDDADASAQRTTMGVAIGSDVQAFDAGLADIAGLAVTDGNFIVGDGANWVAESGATARTSLGAASITTGTALEKNPLANASITTTAHGLGAVPTMVVCYIECVTIDHNYSVGDRLPVPPNEYNGSSVSAWGLEWDATNLTFRTSTNAAAGIPDHDSPYTEQAITLARWKFVATPYLFG